MAHGNPIFYPEENPAKVRLDNMEEPSAVWTPFQYAFLCAGLPPYPVLTSQLDLTKKITQLL